MPIPPMNGEIENFTSREVGAQVAYVCPGNSTIIANCTMSGEWSPSPLTSPCDPRGMNIGCVYSNYIKKGMAVITVYSSI